MKKTTSILFILGLLLTIGPAAGISQGAAETKSDVPELTAFHEVIYPMWHTAYPAKDVKMLRALIPQITELSSKIYTAKLPGILRDKEAKWKEGVAVFKSAVDAYLKAAASPDDETLLKCAEALHAKYESLVRTINPVLPEMDAFHQVLYVLVHTYAPNNEYDKIRSVFPDFQTKSEALLKVQLPSRLAAKNEAFTKAAGELAAAVKELAAAADGHNHEGMLKGVDKVHLKYQALEKIFE
jgi:hypothetical protein